VAAAHQSEPPVLPTVTEGMYFTMCLYNDVFHQTDRKQFNILLFVHLSTGYHSIMFPTYCNASKNWTTPYFLENNMFYSL